MGIIIKQSFRNLVSTYIGIVIGAVNTLVFYPFFFEQKYYGLAAYLLTAANLFWPFMALGAQNAIIKFFSFYKTKKEKDQLLSLALIIPLVFGLILGGLGSLFYPYILGYFEGGNELVQPYAWLIFVIAISSAYFEIFFSWNKVFLKSSFGNFMKEVFHRLGTSILLLAYYFNLIDIPTFIYSIATVFVLRTFVMMISAFHLYFPKLEFSFPSNKKSLIYYSILIFIAGTISVALYDLDKFMIEYFLPIEEVAVYGIPVYIATVIGVPQRAMHQIANPITAQYLNTKNWAALADLYKRSSTNLFLISGLIFVLIISNINQIYEIIPPEYDTGLTIVLLISLVKLVSNIIGNNNSILFNSNYYHYVLVLGVGLILFAILLNYFLIPSYGLEGAAFATFISFFLYDFLKVFFVQKKFSINPFSKQTYKLAVIVFTFTLIFYNFDFNFHPLLNIFIKSTIISATYVPLVICLKTSEEVNDFVYKIQDLVKSYFTKEK